MGGLLKMACRTPGAYTVEGAGDLGWSPTDRRASGRRARTAKHANRPEGVCHHRANRRTRVDGAAEHAFPPPPPSPSRGEGRAAAGGKHAVEESRGAAPGSLTRPSARSATS